MAAKSKAPRLSRDRLLAAAIELADREGIAALTMRRLAEELGSSAMSAYYHVTNKDDLLGRMVDRVVEQMDLADGGGDWKAAIRRTATSAHEVLRRHPWATAMLLSAPTVSAPRLRYMDAMLGCLRRAGFSPQQTDLAYHALDSHIMGFTLWLVGISAGLENLGPVSNVFDLFDADALPHLAEHAQQHLLERQPGEPGAFEFGLDLILEGLERRLAPDH